jgi:hypothetical protein
LVEVEGMDHAQVAEVMAHGRTEAGKRIRFPSDFLAARKSLAEQRRADADARSAKERSAAAASEEAKRKERERVAAEESLRQRRASAAAVLKALDGEPALLEVLPRETLAAVEALRAFASGGASLPLNLGVDRVVDMVPGLRALVARKGAA